MTLYVDGKVVRNPDGHPESLRGARPEQPAFVHGARARSRRSDERSQEIEDELLALPHVAPIDAPACREIAKLMALIERVDRALADGVVESKRRGNARALIETRRHLSRELRDWLKEIGGTPLARATWVATLSSGHRFVDELRELQVRTGRRERRRQRPARLSGCDRGLW